MDRASIRGVVLDLTLTHLSNLAGSLVPNPEGLQGKETVQEGWDFQGTRVRHCYTEEAKLRLWRQTPPKVSDVNGHKGGLTSHPQEHGDRVISDDGVGA
jgi:hypothetical protein